MSDTFFTVGDALRGIRKRKFRVAGILILIPALVLTATLMSPKEYSSSAKLFVRLGRENSSMDATATLGQSPVVATPLSREAEIKSISEMILNRALFEEVVDEIGPEPILDKPVPTDDGDSEDSEPGLVDRAMAILIQLGIVNSLPPREKAIQKLKKNLHVAPIDKSTVILIQYESHSPELSQQVVRLLTDKYLARHGEIHRSPGAYQFLNEQTERLQKDLMDHEKEFEMLRQKTDVVDIDAQRSALVNRLAKITNEKLEADAQRISLEEEISRLENLLQDTEPKIVVEETVGVGNDGVDGMRQELFRLEILKEDLLSKFDASHARVQAIEKQIANSQEILAQAEGSRKESRQGPNPVFQQLQLAINAKTPQLYSLQARTRALQSQLDSIRAESEEFAALETRFNQLRRTISLEDVSYRKYVNNLEEAKIDSLLNNGQLSNISIAQPASLEPKPSKPNKLVNLVLGVLLGMMAACGWAVYCEYRNVMTDSRQELARDAELPLAGELASLPPGLALEELPLEREPVASTT